MPIYVQLIKPLVNMCGLDDAQEAAMTAHYARLQQGIAQGGVLLAGPCEDAALGIVLFVQDDAPAAAAWAGADPAVRAGIMSSEIHLFRLALLADEWPRP